MARRATFGIAIAIAVTCLAPAAQSAQKLRLTVTPNPVLTGGKVEVRVRPAKSGCRVVITNSVTQRTVKSLRLGKAGRSLISVGKTPGTRTVRARCGKKSRTVKFSIIAPPTSPAPDPKPPVVEPSPATEDGDHGELDPNAIPAEYEASRPGEGGPPPTFRIPFPCNERWRTSTYGGHGNALDWNLAVEDGGRPVVASASGTVYVAPVGQYNGGYGNYVIVNHGAGWSTLYAHFQRPNVANGQIVNAGDVLGFVGTTGRSTGNHLHYEQRYNRGAQPLRWSGGNLVAGAWYTSDNCVPREGPSGGSGTGEWAGIGGITFHGSDTIAAQTTMAKDRYILSNDVRYFLAMQADGNLVLYGPGGKPRWASNTAGSGGTRVAMQGDGNLVVYTAADKPVWSSATNGQGASRAVLQDDGNFVIYRLSDGKPTWASNTGTGGWPTHVATHQLSAGSTLNQNQYVRSADKRYAFVMQGDGNLVLYGPGYHALWNSRTNGSGANRAVMQSDGNLVVYRPDGNAVWASNTALSPSSPYLAVQDDGNAVVYGSGNALWSSGTAGRT
jgi:murein DD-endopeptidase MepM/ murein hydrolase activator NlpD